MSASAPVLSTEPEYAKVEQAVDGPSVEAPILGSVYHVDLIADHIKEHGYTAPCLQFPDSLVRDSAQVASLVQERTGGPVYVLADTSYSSCCVDEIAAQHVHGDAIFHFGSACLNPARSLPVIYVSETNVDSNVDAIKAQIPENKKVLVYPDTQHADVALKLATDNVVVALPQSDTASFIPPLPELETPGFSPEIANRVLTRPVSGFDDYAFVYITESPSESLLLYWSTVFSDIKVINGHGERVNSTQALGKRYRYVQMIKAAGTIGILVNTLSLRDTANLLERTKRAIIGADKKHYTFVVGKPNVAKLGNFEAIDVWVVLGCPQGGIVLNDDEYVKPIVTPYELELAFNDSWTGKWLLDFNQVLENDGNVSDDQTDDTDASEEPLFDLVTGKFVFGNTPLRQVSHLDIADGPHDLQKSSNALAIRNTVSTAAQKLQQRTWQGLGSDHADIVEESAELKKGRSGIARNYHEQV